VQTISKDYLEEQINLHKNKNYGSASLLHVPVIIKILNETGITSISDYGAGKKRLLEGITNSGFKNKIEYFPYDPAFPEYGDPRPAELVTVIDVMEHIEPEYLNTVLDNIKNITQKLCYFSISTSPAKKELSDGRNAHLLQHPPRWWLPKICARFEIQFMQKNSKGFVVLAGALNKKT
tara:strand:- start:7036 stop:7569 length:534 start_codon:yes stop_codon:yes gene_type:complete